MTFDEFGTQMARLDGLRFKPTTLQTHWEALKDIPDDVLDAAITRAQHTRSEFPTPVELREDADAVKHRVRRQVEQDNEPTMHCDKCEDSGMRSFWCGSQTRKRHPWLEDRTCDIQACKRLRAGGGDDDYGHEWASRCECWDYNPSLRAKREAQAKYAAARTQPTDARRR